MTVIAQFGKAGGHRRTGSERAGLGGRLTAGNNEANRGEGVDGPAWGPGMGCLMNGSTIPFHALEDRLREFRRIRRVRGLGNGLAMGHAMAAANTGLGGEWPGEPLGLAQHTRLQLAQLR